MSAQAPAATLDASAAPGGYTRHAPEPPRLYLAGRTDPNAPADVHCFGCGIDFGIPADSDSLESCPECGSSTLRFYRTLDSREEAARKEFRGLCLNCNGVTKEAPCSGDSCPHCAAVMPVRRLRSDGTPCVPLPADASSL